MKTVGLKLVDDNGNVYLKGNKSERYYKDDYSFESGIGICYVPEHAMDTLSIIYEIKNSFIPENVLVNAGVAYRRQDIFKIVDADIRKQVGFQYRGNFLKFAELEHYDEFVVYMVNRFYRNANGHDIEKGKTLYCIAYIDFCKKYKYNDLENAE